MLTYQIQTTITTSSSTSTAKEKLEKVQSNSITTAQRHNPTNTPNNRPTITSIKTYTTTPNETRINTILAILVDTLKRFSDLIDNY